MGDDWMEAGKEGSFLERAMKSHIYQTATLISLLVALVTAPLAIPPIQEAIFKKPVSVTVRLMAETPAFDVKKRFPDLSVLYRKRDLTAEDMGLAIAQIRIINTGGVSISESDIANNDNLGVFLGNSRVVGIINSRASSDHLARRAKPIVKQNSVTIPDNIIIDPGDFVQFDILLLKKNNTSIRYAPLGKVEGLRVIKLDVLNDHQEQKPFIWQAFDGGAPVQIARIFAYTVFGLICIGATIGIFERFGHLSSWWKRRRRAAICMSVRPRISDIDANIWCLISNVYRVYGKKGISRLNRHIRWLDTVVIEPDRTRDMQIDYLIRRENESAPQYIRRAFDKVPTLFVSDEIIHEIALSSGIEILDTQTRIAMLEAIRRFELCVDEVAAENGQSVSELEAEPSRLGGEIMLEQEYIFPGSLKVRYKSTKRAAEGSGDE